MQQYQIFPNVENKHFYDPGARYEYKSGIILPEKFRAEPINSVTNSDVADTDGVEVKVINNCIS